MPDRRKESKEWLARAVSHQEWLAGARGLLEDEGPGALRAWIGESLTEEEARDMLVDALVLYHETSIQLHDDDEGDSRSITR